MCWVAVRLEKIAAVGCDLSQRSVGEAEQVSNPGQVQRQNLDLVLWDVEDLHIQLKDWNGSGRLLVASD